jgi:AcrR family transcriptional regulator
MFVAPSTKEQLVLTAEYLFALHGLDGVSLRQIGAAAGNGNNSAVQYHFGSKDALVEAIFEYRMPAIHARRNLLIEQRRPRTLRSWAECFLGPALEQSEVDGNHYLGFIAMLQQHSQHDLLERIPEQFKAPAESFRDAVGAQLTHLPEPLRSHRMAQAQTFALHAGAARERARADGRAVLPFGVHMADLLDGIVGFLKAPVSAATRAALSEADGHESSWPLVI